MEHLFLTLVLLFLAHFIADWTPLVPFKKQIVAAKNNEGKVGFWMFIHGLTVTIYKLFAIIISNVIYPMEGLTDIMFGFYYPFMLVVFFVIELTSHSLIDLLKLDIGVKYNLKPSDKHYWSLIGFDQFLHTLVMFFICYFLYS